MGQVVVSFFLILTWIVTGIVVFVFLCVLLPVRLRAQGSGKISGYSEMKQGPRGSLMVDGSVLFGLARFEASLTTSEEGKTMPTVKILGLKLRRSGRTNGTSGTIERAGRKRESPKKNPKGKRFSFHDAKGLLQKEVRDTAFSTLKRLIKALHLDIKAQARFGFSDPGSTGMVYGWALSFLGALDMRHFRLDPDFTQEVLEMDGSLKLWFLPAHILWIIGSFLLSKNIRPLWRKPKEKGITLGKSMLRHSQ